MTDAEIRSLHQGHPGWMIPPSPPAALDDADLRQLIGAFRGIATGGAGANGSVRSLLAFWLGGASGTAAPTPGAGGWWWRRHIYEPRRE